MTVLILDRFWPHLTNANASAGRRAWASDFAHTLDAEAFHKDREAAVLANLANVQDAGWGHLLVWAAVQGAMRVQDTVLAQPRPSWEGGWADAMRVKARSLTSEPGPLDELLRLWPEAHPDLGQHIAALADAFSDNGEWVAIDLILGAACQRGVTEQARPWIELLGPRRFPCAAREMMAAQARQREHLAQDQRPAVAAGARPRVRS